MKAFEKASIYILFILSFAVLVVSGASAATLHWEPSTGTVEGYKVYYHTSPNGTTGSKDVGDVTSYSLDKLPLSENVQYYFCVSAYNSAGESEPCSPVAYTPGDSTPPLPPVGLLAAVHDEPATLSLTGLKVNSGQSYRVESGLANGKTVYVDRSFTYANVPSLLQGATYIMTANDDKYSTSSQFISFDVNRDATVFVAYDDRLATKPEWMSGFSDTGADLDTDVNMSIYSKNFPAGTIHLGGNQGVLHSGMYTIVVK